MSKKSRESIPLGCHGNKTTELKLLLPIIEPQINEKSIFVEPFCGSCVVSYAIFKKNKIKFHINDLDKNRIDFYLNMRDEEKRNELYNIEKEIVEQGSEKYYEVIKKGIQKAVMNEYIPFVISRRIHSFRIGLFPTTKKIILKEISEGWVDFFQSSKISNNDFRIIMKDYKNNENAFLYLDPPYMDSFNSCYSDYYNSKTYNEDYSVKDNTEMYIFLIEYLKTCKCKVLFSINDCALTRYIYKDYIKETYNKMYSTTLFKNDKANKKHTNVLIISNF
jgi:site-specific DNA-adenine methylase